MKKSTLLLLTAILILSFSACAGPDSPAESASGTADTVSSDNQEIIVHADYESGKLSIEKKNEENN